LLQVNGQSATRDFEASSANLHWSNCGELLIPLEYLVFSFPEMCFLRGRIASQPSTMRYHRAHQGLSDRAEVVAIC
jgi:hypothetical protein